MTECRSCGFRPMGGVKYQQGPPAETTFGVLADLHDGGATRDDLTHCPACGEAVPTTERNR